MSNEELINIAKSARSNAFVPISNYKVGAALLTTSGKVIKGCNIEDSSGIGVTNCCAERCAVIKAISEGEKTFEKIAVVGGVDDDFLEVTPCGVCRQYLTSMAPDIKIVYLKDNKLLEKPVKELLPEAFEEKF